MRKIRGNDISMIFQEPMTALNPVFSIGFQLLEAIRHHQPDMSKEDARQKAVDMLELVGIPDGARRLKNYPHQFSGGMRQRAMIAMALSLNPDVLIADEPTTALDVTVQAQIMELLHELQQDTGMGLLLITHDLGVVAEVCDRVVVMYAGDIMEKGEINDVYHHPAHPYTLGLMDSIPRPDIHTGRLNPIRGAPPDLLNIPSGCPFHPRCDFARQQCVDEVPPLADMGEDGRANACLFWQEVQRDR